MNLGVIEWVVGLSIIACYIIIYHAYVIGPDLGRRIKKKSEKFLLLWSVMNIFVYIWFALRMI